MNWLDYVNNFLLRMIDSYDSAIIPLGSDAVLRDRSQKNSHEDIFNQTNLKHFRIKSLTNLYNFSTCNFIFRYLNPQGGVRIVQLAEVGIPLDSFSPTSNVVDAEIRSSSWVFKILAGSPYFRVELP